MIVNSFGQELSVGKSVVVTGQGQGYAVQRVGKIVRVMPKGDLVVEHYDGKVTQVKRHERVFVIDDAQRQSLEDVERIHDDALAVWMKGIEENKFNDLSKSKYGGYVWGSERDKHRQDFINRHFRSIGLNPVYS